MWILINWTSPWSPREERLLDNMRQLNTGHIINTMIAIKRDMCLESLANHRNLGLGKW